MLSVNTNGAGDVEQIITIIEAITLIGVIDLSMKPI